MPAFFFSFRYNRSMEFIKKLIPDAVLKSIRPFYHAVVAVIAGWYFGHPSREMIVIGVTGTAGKSTTVAMLARILNSNGRKCGFITTVSFFDGESEHINIHGLSMPGGWQLQKDLAVIRSMGCQYAVVECTSEGLAQNRHLGISFQMGVLTNLSPAHLETHGGFENYKKAKGKLFRVVAKQPSGVILVNLDDPNAGYFLSFNSKQKFGAGFKRWKTNVTDLRYLAIKTDFGFELNGVPFEVNLLGDFNKYNALLAASTASLLGVSLSQCALSIAEFSFIRGRMEEVKNNLGFKVIVDYAPEPADMEAALGAISQLPHKSIIHVFGSTGGHRDKAKRFEFGKISAGFADRIVITNDDVYNSDPQEIAENIELGIKNNELRKGEYEIVLDRRGAIGKALSIAQAGDIVVITGKGSEQFLVLPGNRRVVWDEVEVVKQELNKLTKIDQE